MTKNGRINFEIKVQYTGAGMVYINLSESWALTANFKENK